MQKLRFLVAIIVCGLAGAPLHANFLVFADPADLEFSGAGPHSVDIRVSHNGAGPSTLSGYTIKFGSAANASLGVLPTGVTSTSATQVLIFPGGLFSPLANQPLNNNTVAAAGGSNADIGNLGSATLFTLNLNLGAADSYIVGVDFQNAQRGSAFESEDITNEFFNPNSPTTDFTFTLSKAAAIPEPSSLSLLIGSVGIATFFRRRRSV